MSDSNVAELIMVENSIADVMPVDSTAWFPIRLSGSDGLTSTPGTAQSNETRKDGNRGDQVLVSRTTGGAIAGEFSADSWDVFLEAVCQSDFSAGVLKNGSVKKSFTGVRRFDDLTAGNWIRYNKIRVSSVAITWAFGQIASVSVTLVGAGVVVAGADPIGSGSVLAAATTRAMSAADVSAISVNGVTTGICIENGTLTLSRPSRPKNCVNDGIDPIDNTLGAFMAEFKGRLQNSDPTFGLLSLKNAQTPVQLSFSIGDGASSYAFSLPRTFLAFPDPASGGLDTDVTVEATMTAAYDTGISAMVQITKT